MKKLLVLAFLVIMALILTHRQRVFVRDPLATVYESAPNQSAALAKKQHGIQVYINYSNDVLLLHEDQPHPYSLVIQHWNMTPGTPLRLRCVHLMACLTDADHAATVPMSTPTTDSYWPKTTMTNREVSFLLPDGSTIRVTLR